MNIDEELMLDAQEDEADRTAAALAKRFCELHHGDDRKHEIRNRD